MLAKKQKARKGVQSYPTDLLIGSILLDLALTDCPVAIHCFRAWLAKEPPQVSVWFPGFTHPGDALVAHQAVSLLKKAAFLPGRKSAQERRQAALDAFLTSEAECRHAAAHLEQAYYCRLPKSQSEILERARAFISRVLGTFSWDAAVKHCGFGPGASVGVSRRDAHMIKKIGVKTSSTVTGLCVPLVHTYWWYNPHSRPPAPRGKQPSHSVTVVKGCQWSTVPKDTEKDRSKCDEPKWNMFFQKGIGGLIRDRILMRLGVDLNTLDRTNRRLAQQASRDGSMATLDVSGASDSISLRLCEILLPEDWMLEINRTRSAIVSIDGRLVPLEKVSSMGNGFTWELESLIFLALAWASCPADKRRPGRDVMSYGDDIIVPTEAASRVIETLTFCGFKINRGKSFTEGPFRESCGGDFFEGHDITPFRISKEISSITDLYWLANAIRRQHARYSETSPGHQAALWSTYELIVSLIPRRLRLPIPEGIGDVGLVVSLEEGKLGTLMGIPLAPHRPRRSKNWIDGYDVVGLIESPRRQAHLDGLGALWCFHWKRYTTPSADVEFLRLDRPEGVRRMFSTLLFNGRWPTLWPMDPYRA